MSNALAIATVTEALVQTLQGALTGINLGASPHVTNFRPDQENALPTVGVNVFLYQVAPNPSLRNADLPTRAADGTLLQAPAGGDRPPLPADFLRRRCELSSSSACWARSCASCTPIRR